MVSKGYHFYILRTGPFFLTYSKTQRKGFLSFKITHANYLWNRNYDKLIFFYDQYHFCFSQRGIPLQEVIYFEFN